MKALLALIRKLIEKDRTEQALNELLDIINVDYDEDLHNNLSMLKSRFHENKNLKLRGGILEETYDKKLNSIKSSILDIVTYLENDIAKRKSSIQEYVSSTRQIGKEIEKFKKDYFVLPKTELYKNILIYGLLLLMLGAAISYGMMRFNRASTDWKNLSLENTWKNYNSEDFYFEASVRKEKNYVCIRGLIDGGGVEQNIFTLPVGFRPIKRQIFVAQTSGGTCRLDINENGQAFIITPHRNFISLDNICFYVDK